MVFKKKKKQEESDEFSELPNLPPSSYGMPKKFEEKFGARKDSKQTPKLQDIGTEPYQQSQMQHRQIPKNPWRVVEIPIEVKRILVNEETGQEIEINELEDVADILNRLER